MDEYDIRRIHDNPLPEPPPCPHEYGLMVCVQCGYQFPFPAPNGYEMLGRDIWAQEWDDEV